jgi:hypothetical protein
LVLLPQLIQDQKFKADKKNIRKEGLHFRGHATRP